MGVTAFGEVVTASLAVVVASSVVGWDRIKRDCHMPYHPLRVASSFDSSPCRLN